jgi:hypothetical protein
MLSVNTILSGAELAKAKIQCLHILYVQCINIWSIEMPRIQRGHCDKYKTNIENTDIDISHTIPCMHSFSLNSTHVSIRNCGDFSMFNC